MRTLSCSHWVLVSKLSDHECSLSSLRVVNLRGKVCNDYRECLRQSESFAVLSNVRSSRVLWVWMFLTVHYPLYSSDLRLGWQNRILMTARAQCHQTDNTHYNQAIPGHRHQLSCIMLSSRQDNSFIKLILPITFLHWTISFVTWSKKYEWAVTGLGTIRLGLALFQRISGHWLNCKLSNLQ